MTTAGNYLLDDLMQHLAATYSHSNLPALFLQAAPRMCELLTQQGVDFPGVLDTEFELWDLFISQGLRRKGMEMMTNCRFQGSVATAQADVDHWEVDRTARTQALLHWQTTSVLPFAFVHPIMFL